MFGATADLAMSRKMGQSTIEIVKDDTVESTGETIDSI
jgi:hypothetical protein